MFYASVDDLETADFMQLFRDTAAIKARLAVDKAAFLDLCRGRMLGLMFYAPSTRTSGSFEKAMKLLGGLTYDFNIAGSSIAKGESLDDTARMVAMGAEILVIRHAQAGITRHLAEDVLSIPVINAGEGTGEHPTQALLDAYTLWDKYGRPRDFSGLTVGLYGDLAYGRTSHSLLKLATRLGANVVCIAPSEALSMPEAYLQAAQQTAQARVDTTTDLRSVIGRLDALYVTRPQREHTADDTVPAPQDALPQDMSPSPYRVTPDMMAHMKSTALLMHPMPITDEIDRACDRDPRAVYFEQAENGIYTRMALILHYLGLSDTHLRTGPHCETGLPLPA